LYETIKSKAFNLCITSKINKISLNLLSYGDLKYSTEISQCQSRENNQKAVLFFVQKNEAKSPRKGRVFTSFKIPFKKRISLDGAGYSS